ncbi:RNA polymerase I-specific transcription initiation factor rrn3 [Achlya hypogyna]|uniref:RNA polymerase I-specific transcription initiation factor rrn3 n=1 Tax=Achlya hypogyna TaxID=1202772 RepID=A0A1V9Z176_ACHHY|nr:RNA polymerase I-specific transcription initiation factor rrn3 [Achlya hypogyna]
METPAAEQDELATLDALIQSALDYKLKGNATNYNLILSKFEKSASDKDRSQLFLALPRSISKLTASMDAYRELIHHIFMFDFMASPVVTDSYTRLLTHLVTAQTAFVQPAIKMLVRNFVRPEPPAIATSVKGIPRITTLGTQIRHVEATVPAVSSVDILAQFEEAVVRRYENVHAAFAKVLELVPAAIHMVFECLCSAFPHKRRETLSQLAYLNNILKLTTYAKGLQERVLGLIVEKLVAIDVEIKLDNTEEDVFTMDDFLDDDCCADPEADMVDENADKLDHMMLAVFTYFDQLLAADPSAHATLFTYLLKSFDQSVLNTHQSKYPQFLLFYMAKTATEHQELFLSQLISVSLDPKIPPVTRRSCASYLASYVARAKYVSLMAIKHTLFHLLRWIHSQVDLLDNLPVDGIAAAACDPLTADVIQTACYIVCFRGLELCGSEAGYGFVRSLGWQRILMCPLMPFRQPVFQPSVANEFVNVAELLLLLPDECIEELLQWISTSTTVKSASHGMNLERSIVEKNTTNQACFFPFDPYLLRRSFKYIGPLYLFWKHADPSWSGNSEAFHQVQSHMLAYDDDAVESEDGEAGDENASMAGSFASSASFMPGSYTGSEADPEFFPSRSMSIGDEPLADEIAVRNQIDHYHDEEEFGF